MNTLYTFGCSFTAYSWPTWADIIAHDLDLELKNFAQLGLGNYGIAGKLLEVNESQILDESDILMVLWSSWDREDRLKNGQWFGEGSVFCNDEVYGLEWLKKFYDDSDKIMKNIFWIHSVNKMYGDKITWQGSGFDYYRNDTYAEDNPIGIDHYARQVINNYGNLLPELYCWSDAEHQPSFGYFQDSHPDIKKHLALVENIIYPSIGKEIKKETVDYFSEVQYSIVKARKFFRKHKDDEGRAMGKFLNKNWPELFRKINKAKQPKTILKKF